MRNSHSKRSLNEDALKIVLTNNNTRRVFETFVLKRASSMTRLVGDLGLGYDAVRSALELLEQANLIEREGDTSSKNPGIDFFVLTEEGVWAAESLRAYVESPIASPRSGTMRKR